VRTRSRAVELPEHLGEPLVVGRRGVLPHLERPDGSQLPTDRSGRRLARGADGGEVRVEPALYQGDFCHAIRIDDVVVPVAPPLPGRDRFTLYLVIAMVGAFDLVFGPLALLFGLAATVPATWSTAALLRADRPRRAAALLAVGAGVGIAAVEFSALLVG
jgi:hypothetical protein